MSKLCTCRYCGEEKDLSAFQPYITYIKDKKYEGYRKKCKVCYKEQKDQIDLSYRQNNKDKIKKANQAYQKKYPEKNTAKSSRYRANKLKRKPRWLKDHHESQIKSIYKLSRALSKKTGIQHHVDHVVPLQGELVSGLHVPWNLQVLPAKENLEKGNSFTI